MSDSSQLNSTTITTAVVSTAISARKTIDSMQTEDSLVMVNDFIEVMADAQLITIDNVMDDMEMIERAMYAANLYLAACAKLGRVATQRANEIDSLEAMLERS